MIMLTHFSYKELHAYNLNKRLCQVIQNDYTAMIIQSTSILSENLTTANSNK